MSSNRRRETRIIWRTVIYWILRLWCIGVIIVPLLFAAGIIWIQGKMEGMLLRLLKWSHPGLYSDGPGKCH